MSIFIIKLTKKSKHTSTLSLPFTLGLGRRFAFGSAPTFRFPFALPLWGNFLNSGSTNLQGFWPWHSLCPHFGSGLVDRSVFVHSSFVPVIARQLQPNFQTNTQTKITRTKNGIKAGSSSQPNQETLAGWESLQKLSSCPNVSRYH